MAQTFKIEAVSSTKREFESKYGPMVSYRLKLEGVEEPVELTKKTTSPAPTKGSELYGTVDMSSQYGPKFKTERQFDGGGGSKPSYQPKDEKAIQAMWAIGQSAQFLATSQGAKADIADIEPLASDLFAMVDRVKADSKEAPKDGVAQEVPNKDQLTIEDVFGKDVEVIKTDDF